MNVSFLKDDPLNTVVTDSSNGTPLYEVDSPGITNRITTIRRLKAGVGPGEGEIIAEVHWHNLSASTITLSGSTMRVKDYLKKDSIFSSSRIFTASDGNAYKWSRGGGDKFKLTDINTGAEIAQSHGRMLGWFGRTPRKMNIDISPQGRNFLDTLIVTFIIMKDKKDREDNTIITAAVINSGNVAVASS